MGSKLFVGNLSFKTTGDDLKQLFGQVGTCTSATVMTERETGRSRGFAFVEMSSGEEATAAITKFNGHEFEGRRLNVTEARERTPGPRPGGPPRFSPGGGGGGRPRPQDPSNDYAFDPRQSFSRDFGGAGGAQGEAPRKEKGSRRGLRRKKRSL